MRVAVKDIGFERKTFEGEDPAEILELGGSEEDRNIGLLGPVQYRLTVYEVSDQILVEGRVGIRVEFRCSRCDRLFPLKIEEPAVLAVLDIPKNDEYADLTEIAREAILLRFPSHPVCRADCPGLCPLCGGDKGEDQCACRPPIDGRWSALDGWAPSESAGRS